MKEIFARLYEWFGSIPFYSKDMDDYLRGLDFACTGYFAIPWYLYVGLVMIIITVLIFALQNDIIDSRRYKKAGHWGLAAARIVLFNFFFAAAIPFIALQNNAYCSRLKLSVADCIGFGVDNALWSLILFVIISQLPRIKAIDR